MSHILISVPFAEKVFDVPDTTILEIQLGLIHHGINLFEGKRIQLYGILNRMGNEFIFVHDLFALFGSFSSAKLTHSGVTAKF